MAQPTHYQILEVGETASQADIKQAYRRLAKQYHPDSQTDRASHDHIARVNAAYEVLGDPTSRSRYDQQRQGLTPSDPATSAAQRHQRTADMQDVYRRQRRASQSSEVRVDAWLKLVYGPVDRRVAKVMSPLKREIRALSADPFDDELMEAFQGYLETARAQLEKAQDTFRSMASPAAAASPAASLYHCLSQLEEGLDEMERFTFSYEETYLHTGQELFRIARQQRQAAKDRVKRLA